jgi:hypothetical protein
MAASIFQEPRLRLAASGGAPGMGAAGAGVLPGLPGCDCPRPDRAVRKAAAPGRKRIWELGASLHCSIIGTCLSTDELRRLLRKVGIGAPDATDHALHGLAVGLAGRQREVGAKLLNKLLDDVHRRAIRQFEPAGDAAALRTLWRTAVAHGEIPGAYWAVLTHPACDQALVHDAFGEVHMLSHLVGAANRADISRLAGQEREIGALRDIVARQQARLRNDIQERDQRIRALQDMLLAEPARPEAVAADAGPAWQSIVADLSLRLRRETARREAAEARRDAAEAARAKRAESEQALAAENAALRAELAAAEALLAPAAEAGRPHHGTVVLYVGGRSGQTAALREAARRAGAELVHHDAEAGAALLAGMVSRADIVMFPVDCVSHDAALGVKRLCRQFAKPFRPLRSTGAASLLAALRAPLAAE